MLLGLGSIETALPYWLCILSTIGCIAYGIKNWNNAGEPDTVTADVESIVHRSTEE
ncbi:symporter small accessory protein [Halodesulfovibrio spirochaetisodalis]|uniref:symporter small accessory protein n=1 Tax=Halodesulfovibrio spirochaetisodalis TaxID=1560234 RepID=UPI000B0DC57A|nr:symporter small accessory protein [Halodesulfovibrio spirochaetisodalis]